MCQQECSARAASNPSFVNAPLRFAPNQQRFEVPVGAEPPQRRPQSLVVCMKHAGVSVLRRPPNVWADATEISMHHSSTAWPDVMKLRLRASRLASHTAWGARPSAVTGSLVLLAAPVQGTPSPPSPPKPRFSAAQHGRAVRSLQAQSPPMRVSRLPSRPCSAASLQRAYARHSTAWPNPSVEGTSNIWLRQLSAAPHVKR